MKHTRERHDAIVVLGGTVLADGTLAPWVTARVDRALEAFDAGIAARVVFTGRTGVYGPADPTVTEAAAMAAYATQRGLPEDAVMLEEHARDTLGNAYFVRRDILQPNDWRSIRVVTNDFHLSRAAWVFRKVLGPRFDFSFTSAPSGFSPDELIVRALDECRISVFLNEWLATIDDGDELSVDAIMRHHHPVYGSAPMMSAQEMEARLSEIARINRIEGTAQWLPQLELAEPD
ncbi:MAG: YdcF family protein [Gemmatimonadota bacterium]